VVTVVAVLQRQDGTSTRSKRAHEGASKIQLRKEGEAEERLRRGRRGWVDRVVVGPTRVRRRKKWK
jgi:hypothetical protein